MELQVLAKNELPNLKILDKYFKEMKRASSLVNRQVIFY